MTPKTPLNLLRSLVFALPLILAYMTPSKALAQASAEKPAASIAFSNTDYQLAWQSQPMPGYSKYQYLSQGDKLSHYQDMLLLEWVATVSPADAAKHQLNFLKQRKEEGDNAVNHQLIENPQSGEYLLDFILSVHDAKAGYIVEWNAYRYIPYKNADGSQGTQLYGYSMRGYGEDGARDFLIALKDKRQSIIQTLIAARPPQLGGH